MAAVSEEDKSILDSASHPGHLVVVLMMIFIVILTDIMVVLGEVLAVDEGNSNGSDSSGSGSDLHTSGQ